MMQEISGPAVRRRNRRWMVLMLLTPVCLGLIVALTFLTRGPAEPVVKPVVPAGYRAISDAYFGYAIPAAWKVNTTYSDVVGDIFYQGRDGWAAESLGVRTQPPTPGGSLPAATAAFAAPRPTPFSLGPALATHVTGTTVAYRYTATRPGGMRATVIHTWQRSTQTEIWLIVSAPDPVTATIVNSLRA
jgi:hypothetical protein